MRGARNLTGNIGNRASGSGFKFFVTKTDEMSIPSAGRDRKPERALFPNSCYLLVPPRARPKGCFESAGRGPGDAHAVTAAPVTVGTESIISVGTFKLLKPAFPFYLNIYSHVTSSDSASES